MPRKPVASDHYAPTELQFMRQVMDLAKIYRWAVYHPWLSIRSERGWPDLAICKPPRLILAELKSEKGKLSESQAKWLEMLSGCNVEVYVWRPSDIDGIARVLGA